MFFTIRSRKYCHRRKKSFCMCSTCSECSDDGRYDYPDYDYYGFCIRSSCPDNLEYADDTCYKCSESCSDEKCCHGLYEKRLSFTAGGLKSAKTDFVRGASVVLTNTAISGSIPRALWITIKCATTRCLLSPHSHLVKSISNTCKIQQPRLPFLH